MPEPKTYYIWTIGCQMNFADSQHAADELDRLGLIPAERAEEADLIVLNTCVVRQSAEDKASGRLSSLKSVKRHRPDAAIVVMGCLVHEDLAALQDAFPHVDRFLQPSDVASLQAFAREFVSQTEAQPIVAWQRDWPVSAFIPVMHGCDHHCTYCIVTLRRGPGRSFPIPDIRQAAESAVAGGAREITLLGQNIDTYGRDLPDQPGLSDVLTALHDLPDLYRLRFLTSHPRDLPDRLINTVAELPKVCEHFELPVQSGDDKVLRRMGRGYTVAQYRALVERIRARIPHAAIATDIIVGFPGETDAQFQNTLDLIRQIRFDVVHVAAYSIRPGTPAAQWADDVPEDVKIARRQAIENLQEQISREINEARVGRTLKVLVEEMHKGKWKGRTRGNTLVFFKHSEDLQGQLVPVQITRAGAWSLQGELLQSLARVDSGERESTLPS
jgi:tRNA-2-methylthio-N6-dimethylallyladenosine synthase